MDYEGVIIEESLENTGVLGKIKILSTKAEKVTEEHKTPWVSKWTLHTVLIPENSAEIIARELSESLDSQHHWYADFKNERYHFIIFYKKVFRVDRSNPKEYAEPRQYGISIGIPEYQVDFHPEAKMWER